MGEGDGMKDSACVYIYDPTNKDFSFKSQYHGEEETFGVM